MEPLTFHVLLPTVGIALFVIVCWVLRPPVKVWISILAFAWVVGLLNLVVDIVQQNIGMWHYTLGNPYGYPFSLYGAISLLGATLAVLYWRFLVNKKYNPGILLLLVIAYLVVQDYVFITLTGDTVVVFDHPSWWISDFLSISVIVWGTFFMYKTFVFSKIPPPRLDRV